MSEVQEIAGKPTDEQILAAVQRFGNRTMTYVARNVLSMAGFNMKTPWVLRQLKRLEREGKVERVSSGYATQLCWAVRAHLQATQTETK